MDNGQKDSLNGMEWIGMEMEWNGWNEMDEGKIRRSISLPFNLINAICAILQNRLPNAAPGYCLNQISFENWFLDQCLKDINLHI